MVLLSSEDNGFAEAGGGSMSENNQDLFDHETEALRKEGASVTLLVLVGLPGSGKSTFCSKMMQSSSSKWMRVCQDVISNGKRGSKEHCLKYAERCLNQGFNVIIDRCNLTRDQRHEFVKLSRRLQVEAQALVLDFPTKLCIQRALQRTSHEGGLEGKSAPAAIQRMAQSKELPSKDEGFSSIVVCNNDKDLESALKLYCGSLASFEEESKVNVQGLADLQENTELNLKTMEARHIDTSRDAQGTSFLSKGAMTLAFPSISTADFQFDHEKAADIIVEVVMEFLQKYGHYGIRLLLVDLKADSDMLARVNCKVAQHGQTIQQFSTLAGDITRLHSTRGMDCNFIANAANWRLKAGGGGVNAAIFKAAGEGLELETKKRAKTLNPGTALVVPLPEMSPLHVAEGVTHVIHVLGPNMNPLRPNYLQGDYAKGCKILRDTYSCMLEAFAAVIKSTLSEGVSRVSIGQNTQSKVGTSSLNPSKPRNAFDLLMQSVKRRCVHTASEVKEKVGKQDVDPVTSVSRVPAGQEGAAKERQSLLEYAHRSSEKKEHTKDTKESNKPKKSKSWGSWAEVLRNCALNPVRYDGTVLQVTQEAVVISDKFPKAQKHLLVVARKDGIDSIEDLESSDIPLLQHMHELGLYWAKSFISEDQSLVFRLGYHSEPSMRQLHLHVISQDFDSPSMKNKKHWNSFTSDFFRDSKCVIEELKKTGCVMPCGDEESLLQMELRCHKCHGVQPNIPRLKNHIRYCPAPLSAELTRQGLLITC